MTTVAVPKFTVSILFVLAAAIVFALGVFGVHVGSVSGIRWAEVGLFFLAISFIVP